MTPDPITNIEERKTWMDFGRQAYFIFLGARAENASVEDAMKMVAAFYAGMFRGSYNPPSEDGDEDETV